MKLLLRLEHAALAALLIGVYAIWGGSWWLFAALILVPDVSFAAYLFGPRIGAIGYNALHSFIGVVLLAAASWLLKWQPGYDVALIWAVHIAFDRTLGYGLKYSSGFTQTHLGVIGKGRGADS